MRAYCNYCGKKIRKTPRVMSKAKSGVYCNRECFHKWYHGYYLDKTKEKKEGKKRDRRMKICEICKKKTEYARFIPRPDMKTWIWMCWDCVKKYCEEQVMKPKPKGMCIVCKVKPVMNQGNKYECNFCRDCFFATAIID